MGGIKFQITILEISISNWIVQEVTALHFSFDLPKRSFLGLTVFLPVQLYVFAVPV
jgi:hypothetical protein